MFAAQSSTPSFSSTDIATPICPSRLSIVVTSRRCGTFSIVSASRESNDAQRIGSAAFFAPEIATSPCSAMPPSMTSLSTLRLPFFGRERLHRKRVDLLAHAVAERGVDELVLLHLALAAEERAHDDRFEVTAVACDLDVLAFETLFDVLL